MLADSSILVNCLCTANTTVKANSVMMHCRVEVWCCCSCGSFVEERLCLVRNVVNRVELNSDWLKF